MAKAYAIIPARKNSTRVKGKNMKRLAGSPLIVWTLEAVASAKRIAGAVVTSDDTDLLVMAQLYDKVHTLLRQPALSGDDVPDLPVVMDAIYRGSISFQDDDVVVFLRPTAPFRRPEEIDHVADLLLNQASADSVRSVVRPKHHPRKMYLWSEHTLVKYTSDHAANSPSQGLEPVCAAVGFIDAIRVRTLRDGDMEGVVVKPWLAPVDRCVDLDTEEEFVEAERLATANGWGPGRIR